MPNSPFLDIALRRLRGETGGGGGRYDDAPEYTGRNSENGGRAGTGTRLPLGVPEGYTTPVPTNLRGMTTRAAEGWANNGLEHGSLYERGPRYYENDEWAMAPRTPQGITALQMDLAQAGLLPDGFIPGVWDHKSASAYAELMSMANAAGITAEQMMTQVLASGQMEWDPETGTFVQSGLGAGSEVVAPPPELVTRITDPKMLDSAFRRAAIEIMGIGWSREEIDNAVAVFNQIERDRQRQMYDAQLAAGQLGSLTEGQDPQAQEVVDIPSPEGWIDSYIREQEPEKVAVQEGMNMLDVFMQTATSPSWGTGGQVRGSQL